MEKALGWLQYVYYSMTFALKMRNCFYIRFFFLNCHTARWWALRDSRWTKEISVSQSKLPVNKDFVTVTNAKLLKCSNNAEEKKMHNRSTLAQNKQNVAYIICIQDLMPFCQSPIIISVAPHTTLLVKFQWTKLKCDWSVRKTPSSKCVNFRLQKPVWNF